MNRSGNVYNSMHCSGNICFRTITVRRIPVRKKTWCQCHHQVLMLFLSKAESYTCLTPFLTQECSPLLKASMVIWFRLGTQIVEKWQMLVVHFNYDICHVSVHLRQFLLNCLEQKNNFRADLQYGIIARTKKLQYSNPTFRNLFPLRENCLQNSEESFVTFFMCMLRNKS